MKLDLKTLTFMGAALLAACTSSAQSPEELNDLEIAHVAYIADNIDIQYAHLALALSENSTVREFAETMVRDHNGVNAQALALLEKLGAQPQNNFLSESLQANAKGIVDNLTSLRGADFDRAYAQNELAYHQAVNDLVENAFIPNIENAEVKALFEAGLEIFKAHEAAAELMVAAVK